MEKFKCCLLRNLRNLRNHHNRFNKVWTKIFDDWIIKTIHDCGWLLDWHNTHPNAVAYATGYQGTPSGWVWRDKDKVSHDAESLTAALRAAIAAEGEKS